MAPKALTYRVVEEVSRPARPSTQISQHAPSTETRLDCKESLRGQHVIGAVNHCHCEQECHYVTTPIRDPCKTQRCRGSAKQLSQCRPLISARDHHRKQCGSMRISNVLLVGTLEVAGQAGKVPIWEPFLHTSIQCSQASWSAGLLVYWRPTESFWPP